MRRRGKTLGHVDPFRYSERFSIGSATTDTAGSALTDAAYALLNHFDVNGVTPEHTQDPVVGAFQLAWNADPANAGDQLTHDEQYGPLTKGALAAIVGNVAQNVNAGPTPKPAPAPSPAPPVPTPSPSTSGGDVFPWLLVGGAAVAAYFLFFRKKKKTHHHHAPGTTIELRRNPRRAPRRRNDFFVA